MGVIKTNLIIDPASVWSSVSIKLTNTYSDQVDINNLVVNFTNPYSLNGNPWGIDGIESTGGSLTSVSTPIGSSEVQTQITLHWPSAHFINPNQSVTIAFTLAGEVHEKDFQNLHADLVNDPTAKLSFFLKAPPPPAGATTEQVEVIVKRPAGNTQSISIPFGDTAKVDHLFEGDYNIYPQPVTIGNATYYPEKQVIPFHLVDATSGTTISLEYQTTPQVTVPVEFALDAIGLSNITTNMYLNGVAYTLTFGSSSTVDLIADKTYTISFNTKTVNNIQYVVDYPDTTYTPSSSGNRVSLPVKHVNVNTSKFISTNLHILGVPAAYTGNVQVELLEDTTDLPFVYIFYGKAQQNIPIGLVKPGSYTIFAQNLTYQGVKYKFSGPSSVTISSTSSQITTNFDQGFNLQVKGWPPHLAHGGITFNSSSDLTNYKNVAVECIFKYAGVNGGGDRGVILDPKTIPTHGTIQQARSIEESQGYVRSVMPAMVFYTADFSSGISNADFTDENLKIHYINLINDLLVAESYKNPEHPVPCTYILNPDFLGMIQQNKGTSPDIDNLFKEGSIPVNKQLKAAIAHLSLSDIPPVTFEEDIHGYIQSINWVVRHFGPDSPFGWQFNVWQTGNAYWAYQNPDQTDQIATKVSNFIDSIKVYQGAYAPDFVVFDKYERDDFSPDAINAYAWGARSWIRYLRFVNKVSTYLRRPAMLWQIPGGHMPNTTEGSTLVSAGHAGSGGDFFMGDSSIGSNLDQIDPSLLNLQVTNPYYYASTVKEILQQDLSYNWAKQQLVNAVNANVFGILWGGGRTTTLIPSQEPGTDPKWLSTRVDQYYKNPISLN